MAPVRSDGGIQMNDHIPDPTKMISDTPRTDAHNWKDGDYDDPLHAFYDFAGQLERELNAANDRIKRLEELGDTLANCTADNPYNAQYAEKWWELKEAKP